VLILRDVVGWPADRAAAALDTSVPSANSALQRARRTLRDLLGPTRADWPAAAPATDDERALVRRYVDAVERADDQAIAAVLAADAVVSHQPGAGGNDTTEPGWYGGRSTIVEAWAPALHGPTAVAIRMVPVAANRQPAVVSYARIPGTDDHVPFALSLLRIEHGEVVEVTNFRPENLGAFVP